jgi:hypothetical protein
MIENRKLKSGTKLWARYKGREYRAKVVAGEGDKPRYRLSDGREFKTPSAAGSAVMGGTACNGWRWWSVAGEVKPARAATKSQKAGTKAKAAKSKAKGGAKGKTGTTRARKAAKSS